MCTRAHASTRNACSVHTEESRIHINKHVCNQRRLELWITLIWYFWLLFIFYCYIICIIQKHPVIVIYKKRFWLLEKTSVRVLRPELFENTLSTAVEEAPGPRALPCWGPYLRWLRPLSEISAQAAVLCLLIGWGLNQRWGGSWPLESVWRTFSVSCQWVT